MTARAQVVDAEDGFTAHIAQERAGRGIPALTFAADLQVVARRHAQRMADRGEPYHNPDLGSEVQGWSIAAENVGVGYDVDAIHQAFMESTTHRDIILKPDLTELGVGVLRTGDGQLWVVEVFRRPESADAAALPPPAPPAPAPPSPAATPPTVALAPSPPTPASVTTGGGAALPRTELLAAHGRMDRRTPARTERFQAAEAAPAAIAPDVAGLARQVPPAAWVAAFLLAAVVGFQGQVLRRLDLV